MAAAAAAQPVGDEKKEANPFTLPPDDQMFLIREQERRSRAEQKELTKSLRVWEKTTSSSRLMGGLNQRRMRDSTKVLPEDTVDMKQAAVARRSASDSSLGVRNARRDKENVSDFVAKKREMFLVQMSLDVKKTEIEKLVEKSRLKEDALKRSQMLLDEDVTRFDAFLQQNDRTAHQAMRAAEDTTRKKQDKVQLIKHMRTQLAAFQSEIARHREQKDECLKYKDFLVKLTPPEWKDARDGDKRERKAARRQRWVDDHFAESESKVEEEILNEERASEEKAAEHAVKNRRRPRRELEEAERERERELENRKRRIRRRYPGREHFEAEYEDVSSGEEMPLFFKQPSQLLDVFTSLEGSNLFLIQNSQDKEQTLEELQQSFNETRRVSGAKSDRMRQSLKVLEQQIEEDRTHIRELKEKLSHMEVKDEHDHGTRELLNTVIEVNSVCGHDTEHDPDALQMLTAIEAKLEEHLSALSEAEHGGFAALVERLERDADMRRREQLKRGRKEAQEKKSEERLKASLLRSQAPIHKKTGKQIMFRSAPLLRMKRVVVEDDGYEEAKRQHSVFGVHLGRDGLPDPSEPMQTAG